MPKSHVGHVRRRLLVPIVAVLLATMAAAPVAAARPEVNFITDEDAMMWNLAGGSVEALVTVGDELGSFMFDAIPDGISVTSWGSNSVKVFINHETSTVPFPYSTSSPGGNLNDFTDSLVSRLRINRNTHKITDARYILDDGDDIHRLCSNFLATSVHGFDRPILLTNEEGIDWVNRAGLQWPATEGDDDARQIGAVVARDLSTGTNRIIWGMGRHNHENSLPLKGYGHPVVLSGDDSFVTSPNQSQVYSYIADSREDLWNDDGDLWAFVSDDTDYDDYYDFAPGSTQSVSGHFIMVPKEIATGRNPDGSDMMAADVPAYLGGPYGPPPSDGGWQRPPGVTTGPGVDGPQWVLEHWSDLNNVFSFVRVEDMAYDKRQGMRNVVYIVDSGRGRGPADSAGLDSDGNPVAVSNKSTNGRVWKMVLDKADPTIVTSFSILIEGDDNPTKTLTEVRQPDNIETTKKGIYLTEDPGSSQQFPDGDQAGKNARVWQYRFSDSLLTPVLEVNQDADEGATDVDSTGAGNMGAWEASGIIDVSQWFGPGMFLITVQAHTLFIETAPGPDINDPPTGIDWTYKREGGQLLLVQIPGG